MSLCARDDSKPLLPSPSIIAEEPHPRDSPAAIQTVENIRLQSYREVKENITVNTPSGEVLASQNRATIVSRLDLITSISPTRNKILELLRPEDPGKDTLEAIVRPTPRRLVRPYDEDTRRFLQRALLPPDSQQFSRLSKSDSDQRRSVAENERDEIDNKQKREIHDFKKERSLAEELREAEEDEKSGPHIRKQLLREFRKRGGGTREAMERDRLGKLALAVEDDEEIDEDYSLSAAARKLDALLVESRNLHEELAGIHQDIQTQCARACRCTAAARALSAESRALRYLDDVVALLRGDLDAARRTRAWPFAFGARQPGRNYII
ncbi:hypothetical protein KGM_201896 [Danaus plexippus plexippus]|uniref:Uncharacterized protein n=1 Tax=Danaus plexippus plexippus TaxID=278856 RepID=A0A212F7Y4_DANPL|nr:hypothetical protein KGM_201896 [Danaus plexippus plexippus]